MNIQRLSGLPPSGQTNPSRPPTAFQDFLDQHEITRLKSWRATSSSPDEYKITDRVKLE